MIVPTPIESHIRDFALASAAPVHPDALAQVKGQEHLLLRSGFIAQIASMADLPSLSPGMSKNLHEIADRIDVALEALDPELRVHMAVPLGEYRNALRLLSEIGFFQSAFVIAYLKLEVIDRPLAQQMGVELDQLDMSVKLLKLARKNSDGSPWLEGEKWR